MIAIVDMTTIIFTIAEMMAVVAEMVPDSTIYCMTMLQLIKFAQLRSIEIWGFQYKEVKEYLESKEDKQQEMIKARILCMKEEIVRLKEQIDLAENSYLLCPLL